MGKRSWSPLSRGSALLNHIAGGQAVFFQNLDDSPVTLHLDDDVIERFEHRRVVEPHREPSWASVFSLPLVKNFDAWLGCHEISVASRRLVGEGGINAAGFEAVDHLGMRLEGDQFGPFLRVDEVCISTPQDRSD